MKLSEENIRKTLCDFGVGKATLGHRTSSIKAKGNKLGAIRIMRFSILEYYEMKRWVTEREKRFITHKNYKGFIF